MTFQGVVLIASKDTFYYDEYIAIQYELNKLEGDLNIRGYGMWLLTKQFISYSFIKQVAYT